MLLCCCGIVSAQEAMADGYEVKVGEFTELRVVNSVNVIYSNNPDSIGYVQFRAPKDLCSAVLVKSSKGKVTIELSTEAVNNPKLPTVFVYSKFIQSVENAGDSTILVTSVTPVPEIKFRTVANGKIVAKRLDANKISATISTGKGSILLDGKCSYASLILTGTGKILAEKLKSTDTYCRITGTGHITCNPQDKLTMKGTGPGKVYYLNKPAKIENSKIFSLKHMTIAEMEADKK